MKIECDSTSCAYNRERVCKHSGPELYEVVPGEDWDIEKRRRCRSLVDVVPVGGVYSQERIKEYKEQYWRSVRAEVKARWVADRVEERRWSEWFCGKELEMIEIRCSRYGCFWNDHGRCVCASPALNQGSGEPEGPEHLCTSFRGRAPSCDAGAVWRGSALIKALDPGELHSYMHGDFLMLLAKINEVIGVLNGPKRT